MFAVKYGRSKRGKILITKFMALEDAETFLKSVEGQGYRGIITKHKSDPNQLRYIK